MKTLAMKSTLKKEQKFYDAHKAEFVEKYLGKNVLIYQNKLQGVFETGLDALRFAKSNNFTRNKFMIKQVVKKEPVYVMIPSIIQVEGD